MKHSAFFESVFHSCINELDTTPIDNRYQIGFIGKYQRDLKLTANICTVSKKLVQINLWCTIEEVHNTVKLILIERTNLFELKGTQMQRMIVSYHFAYDLKFSCGYNYIGRTDR